MLTLIVYAVNIRLVSMTRSQSPRRRAPRGYHHGDLKAALVEAAVAILHKEGLEGLTLRAVARKAGVSQAAPYRHFADRRALMAAVAERGFHRLRQAMMDAMSAGQGRVGLKGVALAYVQFALENPPEYRLMFGAELAATDDLPTLRETGRSVLGFVAEGIAQLQRSKLVGEGDPMLMAAATWSTLHGLSILILDGQTTAVAPNVNALVEEATRIMMFGMAGANRRGPSAND
jgi:AcrR family transcriptional regulator